MRGVVVFIKQCIVLTDFTVFLIREFDAIFGMDGMTRHRALIDYKKKKVKLTLKWNTQIIFQGRGIDRG